MFPPRNPAEIKHNSVVFFDIDGTLLLTQHGRQAMNDAFQHHFGISEAFESISFAGATDPDIFKTICEQHGFCPTRGDHRSFFHDYYQRLDHLFDDRINILPGSHEILRILRGKNLHLGVITGNNPGSANVKLREAGFIDYFDGGAYGDDGPIRADIVAAAIRRFQIDPTNAVLIGDSIRDIQTGKKHGVHTVAVPTGTTSCESLNQEDPDLLLTSLDPPAALLTFIETTLPLKGVTN